MEKRRINFGQVFAEERNAIFIPRFKNYNGFEWFCGRNITSVKLEVHCSKITLVINDDVLISNSIPIVFWEFLF